ncbi:hypothetical protein AAFF_G00335560 [Aldrovandia affinis]|uniref:Uncharacterized protein n=1 Tax=Aldrovandia affinis TaxID=143900 RepID=A0AAD7SLH7_9TELE|nr:hypothetical protein AAFF_G00335560 [Aldrovandia affinis]
MVLPAQRSGAGSLLRFKWQPAGVLIAQNNHTGSLSTRLVLPPEPLRLRVLPPPPSPPVLQVWVIPTSPSRGTTSLSPLSTPWPRARWGSPRPSLWSRCSPGNQMARRRRPLPRWGPGVSQGVWRL